MHKRLDLAYVVEIVRAYASSLVRHGGIATLVVGACGLVALLSAKRPLAPMTRRLALFFAADLALVFTLNPFHGSRRAFVSIALLAVFAGQGVERLANGCVELLRGRRVTLAPTLIWSAAALAVVLHLGSSVQAGLGDVERHASEPLFARAHEAGAWLAENAPADARVIAVIEHEVQWLALKTWTTLEVVNALAVSFEPSTMSTPTHVVDLGGEPALLARCLGALDSRATLELAFAPHASEPPRIWRVLPR